MTDPGGLGHREILRRDQLVAVVHAVVQLQLHPGHQVVHRRVDRAGAAELVGEDRGERHLDRAVRGVAVSDRGVVRALDRLGGEGGPLHAERIDDGLLGHHLPVRRAECLGHDMPGDHVGDVGIGEAGAEARHRLDVAQGTDHRRLIEAEEADEVVDVGRQPGPLRQEVEEPELLGGPRVLELELRIAIDHPVVPLEELLVHTHRQRRPEERLGGRADLEDRVGIDRRAALAAEAEPLGIDQLVAGDDADGEAGIVEGLHPARDIGLELGLQRVDPRLHRLLGGRQAGRDHRKRKDARGQALPFRHRTLPLV